MPTTAYRSSNSSASLIAHSLLARLGQQEDRCQHAAQVRQGGGDAGDKADRSADPWPEARRLLRWWLAQTVDLERGENEGQQADQPGERVRGDHPQQVTAQADTD